MKLVLLYSNSALIDSRFCKSLIMVVQWIGGLSVYSCMKWWQVNLHLKLIMKMIYLNLLWAKMFCTQYGLQNMLSISWKGYVILNWSNRSNNGWLMIACYFSLNLTSIFFGLNECSVDTWAANNSLRLMDLSVPLELVSSEWMICLSSPHLHGARWTEIEFCKCWLLQSDGLSQVPFTSYQRL